MTRFLPPRARAAGDRRRRFARLFLAEIRSGSLSNVDVAFDEEDHHSPLLGAAVWQSPNSRTPLWRTARELPGMLRAFGFRGLRELRRYGAQTGSHAPDGPHWHLLDIGASPAARGKGVGGALLTHRLAIIDAERESAFLEATTPGSRRLYERYAFEAITVIEQGPAAGAAMMLRVARP